MEKDKVGRYEFMAEPFHCDFSKRLLMGHLGNHLLNAADYHSHDRGFGMSFLNTINKTWVLSRLAVEMEEMPAMYTRFDVETWVETAMRFFTNRNFKVIDSLSGKVYGYGRSVWAMIDTETRQPANLLEVNEGALGGWQTHWAWRNPCIQEAFAAWMRDRKARFPGQLSAHDQYIAGT